MAPYGNPVARRPADPAAPRRGPAHRVVRRYGWRTFAVPVLVAVTIAALVHSDRSGHPDRPVTRDARGSTAGFRAGATPAPVVVHLASDAITKCAANGYRQLIVVSISKQHLWACQGTRQVEESPVTTGNVVHHDQTPLGAWRVQGKQRDRYLVGPGYRDYVHYWVPFNGDFGLHDAPWQTMPFGSTDWRTEGSHGCVHTPTDVMSWLYRWVRVGQTVVDIEA